MKRRDLFGWLGAGIGGWLVGQPARAIEEADTTAADPEADDLPADYFLDAGELTEEDQQSLVQVAEIEELQMKGEPMVAPRGLRSKRAPTYRLVYWDGDVGDPNGRFVSPLSVRPNFVEPLAAYQINAQILGFHGATDEWRGRNRKGALTVELRGMIEGESMTWMFAQPFDMDSEGFTNLGYEYVAQRDGTPQPVLTDDLNLGVRIQLLRHRGRGGTALRKFLGIALSIAGVAVDFTSSNAGKQLLPPMRVPAMTREGLALAQAVVGGTAEEVPLWRGGFSSYSVAEGGSRLSLRPGYWMAIDSGRQIDLRDVMLDDLGGSIAATRNGELVDANFLILGLEIGEGTVPNHMRLAG